MANEPSRAQVDEWRHRLEQGDVGRTANEMLECIECYFFQNPRFRALDGFDGGFAQVGKLPSERALELATAREAARHPPNSALIVTMTLADLAQAVDERLGRL